VINLDFLQRESASKFNTTLYIEGGEMPVDIVSFGYMSLCLAGVIIVAILFGTLLRCTENLFSYRKNFVACMFASPLMINLEFRVMYGDPVLFMNSFFRYIIAIIVIIMFLKLEKLPRIVWKKARL